MVRVKGGFAVAPRCAPKARTLDARQPVRPSFHQAHQGGLSPSEGWSPSGLAQCTVALTRLSCQTEAREPVVWASN
jgi:hypothetical protein